MRVPVNIDNSPLIKILPIVILGILIGDWIELAWWIAGIGAAVCALCLVAFKGSALVRTLYGALTIFCTALTISEINSLSTIAPHHQPIEAVVEIIDNSAMTSGGYNRTTARIVAVDDGDNQSVVREKIYLISPTELSLGKVYKVAMTIGDIGGEGYDGYARVMRRRGYTGSAFVAEDSVQEIEGQHVSPLVTFGPRMQSIAKERLAMLGLPPSAMALSEAMTLGIRDGLSEELKADYSRSGAYHLLAVSGLHIGIIALLINTLLLPLPLIRGGHRARNIIAIALIWLYTLLTGAAPSAVRSAVMFSGAQIAYSGSMSRSPINILCGTAAIMLLANPNNLFDLSFQLSFLAVMGIALFYNRLYRLGKSNIKITNTLWRLTAVAIAATIATAPITSHVFGQIPLAGVLISPYVVITAYVCVAISVLWIVLPLGFIAEGIRWVITTIAYLQDRIVEFSADKWWIAADVAIPLMPTITTYLLSFAAIILHQQHTTKRVIQI